MGSKRREKKKRQKKSPEPSWRSAKTSDRHELYELSVQNPEAEVDFLDKVFRKLRDRKASTIREDFCGTAAASAEWVRRRPDNRAIGVDLDPAVLEWGRERLQDRLGEDELERLEMLEADVMEVETDPVDAVLAMNFSYFIFKRRDELVKYFRRVRSALAEGGLFFLDAYGGSESFEEIEEERDLDGFTYVWDQHHYNPITGDVVNYIHFRFPDGSEMKRAFTYRWRLWTLPELQEALLEAGFETASVYWEGTDEDGEGDGNFRATTKGEACAGWIAYLVAER